MTQMTSSSGQPRWRTGGGVDIHLGDERSRSSTPAFSGAALLMSVVFLVLLIVAPDRLDAAWQWIRDLPIVLEVFAWVLLLPWMLAYLAWNASWVLWLRVVAVAILTGGFALSFWRPSS